MSAVTLLVLLVGLDLIVTFILARAAWRRPSIPALDDRLFVSFTATIAASIAVALVASRLDLVILPAEATVTLATLTAILISLPNVLFLMQYLRGRFG